MSTLILKVAKVLFFIYPLFLVGCASVGIGSKLPEQILKAPAPDLQYSEIVGNIADYQDVLVRWGGEILNIEEGDLNSNITVLEHPITASGRPDYDHYNSDHKHNRFIVKLTNDALNSRFKRNNFITVYGQLSGSNTLTIKENLSKEIPIINAIEAITWPSAKRYDALRYQMRIHNRALYGGFYHDFYSNNYFYYPRRYHRHYQYYRPRHSNDFHKGKTNKNK